MKNFKKSGFTLIEALVAIGILMVAIAGPMTLTQKSLSTATESKNQMIAGELVQDAMESVKNIRDTIAIRNTSGDWLLGTNETGPWDGLLSLGPCVCNLEGDKCNFDVQPLNYCTIDSTTPTWAVSTFFTSPQSIDPGGNPVPVLNEIYNINSQTGATTFLKYGYDPVSASPDSKGHIVKQSKFTRYINIKKTGGLDGNEAVITVRVTWDSPMGLQKTPDTQDFIYNYSGNL